MTASGPDQALERFRIIRPFLEEGIALAAIARHHGIALRTARRWVSHYRAGGRSALTRSPRSDKGVCRALSATGQVSTDVRCAVSRRVCLHTRAQETPT